MLFVNSFEDLMWNYCNIKAYTLMLDVINHD